jgi:hypothetical protein
MIALECLFVEGRGPKGTVIAERLTERFRLNELTKTDQISWLERLYRARNGAVHEGRQFTNDLEVDRLLEVTQYVIRRMSLHLIPGHRRKGRSCTTFEAAMRCSLK